MSEYSYNSSALAGDCGTQRIEEKKQLRFLLCCFDNPHYFGEANRAERRLTLPRFLVASRRIS
ncbi:MAG: hypothetical protein RBG13Loki_1239 [Promethearchaeota archaeon CR_4]|nr:MAG: hypothetical protein RBG13Loki_1239 [Candidatus Lokiarchaeota archaeon CR_4]